MQQRGGAEARTRPFKFCAHSNCARNSSSGECHEHQRPQHHQHGGRPPDPGRAAVRTGQPALQLRQLRRQLRTREPGEHQAAGRGARADARTRPGARRRAGRADARARGGRRVHRRADARARHRPGARRPKPCASAGCARTQRAGGSRERRGAGQPDPAVRSNWVTSSRKPHRLGCGRRPAPWLAASSSASACAATTDIFGGGDDAPAPIVAVEPVNAADATEPAPVAEPAEQDEPADPVEQDEPATEPAPVAEPATEPEPEPAPVAEPVAKGHRAAADGACRAPGSGNGPWRRTDHAHELDGLRHRRNSAELRRRPADPGRGHSGHGQRSHADRGRTHPAGHQEQPLQPRHQQAGIPFGGDDPGSRSWRTTRMATCPSPRRPRVAMRPWTSTAFSASRSPVASSAPPWATTASSTPMAPSPPKTPSTRSSPCRP